MKKYLIAVDLDGTLLPDLYSLSPYSVKVFNTLREMGHKIVITTGRPYRSSHFVYDAFNLDTPLINYNGCLVTNPSKNNEIISSDVMDKEVILDIYNKNKDKFSLFFCEAFDKIYSNLDGESYRHLMHYSDECELVIGDLNEILDTNYHGSLILGKDGKGKEIKEYVEKNCKNMGARIWRWEEYKDIVELFATTRTKGDALKEVRELLGFSKEDTIACGDSQNDFEFFSEAGITVSLNNADPSIKAISTYVYPVNCWDDGIAKFFDEFFKLNIKE